MMDFVVKIKYWWAGEAMIASDNHAYQVAYKTTYEVNGPIGVTKYGNSHVAPFQFEFQALSSNPRVVTEAIRNYPMGEKDKSSWMYSTPRPPFPNSRQNNNRSVTTLFAPVQFSAASYRPKNNKTPYHTYTKRIPSIKPSLPTKA